MQTHNLKRTHKNKKDRIIGRGGKHAKTSGRGGKGQTARAGNKRRPELRDIIKKLPKLRGYAFNSFAEKPVNVSLDKILVNPPKDSVVNVAYLLDSKIVSLKKGKNPKVKILKGKDNFNLKIKISGCSISESAKELVLKNGGEILTK